MTSRYSADSAYQRDRTQLFPSRIPSRAATASPYDAQSSNDKYSESLLSTLESQNDEEMDVMGQKIHMLKNLGERMGVEINKSINMNQDITDRFERGKITLKNTFNKMVVMSQKAGISWKMWLLVFTIVFVFFWYIWFLR